MGSTFEILAVPTFAADAAERWLGREVEVYHLDPDGWVVLQAWEWDDVRGVSPPSLADLDVDALLWAACFDSDYAIINFEGLETEPGWFFVAPDVAGEFGEGLAALRAARALQGPDVHKEGIRRFLAWARLAPREITTDEVQAALDEDTPLADEKLSLLLVSLGLGPTEGAFADALPVTDQSDHGWPRVRFRLQLQRRLDAREQSLLDQAFTVWYQWWIALPYESVRDMTDIELTDTSDGQDASWEVDFGVADHRALDSLVDQLRSAAARGVPAIKLVIGPD
jgi:hypothetical protein